MADELLIRLFDVGLGDCIYCRIPRAHSSGRDFHILIDCGSLSGLGLLRTAVGRLKELLPVEHGKVMLDLLVVTHEHKDHMAGFGIDIWDDFRFGAIWMSAAMDPDHPEAAKANKIHAFAQETMSRALALNLSLSPQMRILAEATALNVAAITALRSTLPKKSGIQPIFAHAATDAPTRLPLQGATISVLGPEMGIDHFYLGEDGDPSLRTTLARIDVGLPAPEKAVVDPEAVDRPNNIDEPEFRQLRKRMLSTAFAFADLDGNVTNNTSAVLLIEWNDKRLLFVGDAEWDAGFRENKANCAWNVMWSKRQELLGKLVDFLKVGHHGSVNATPWGLTEKNKFGEPKQILDAILPVGRKASAQAAVSTRRGNYETIPRSDLLLEIGAGVASTCNSGRAFDEATIRTDRVPNFEAFEQDWFDSEQPRRTDMEALLGSPGYINVIIR